MCNDNVTLRKTKWVILLWNLQSTRGERTKSLLSLSLQWMLLFERKDAPFWFSEHEEIAKTNGHPMSMQWWWYVPYFLCQFLRLSQLYFWGIFCDIKRTKMLRKIGGKQLLKMIIPLRICHASAPNPSKKRTYDCKMWSIFWHTWEELHAYTHTFKQNEK